MTQYFHFNHNPTILNPIPCSGKMRRTRERDPQRHPTAGYMMITDIPIVPARVFEMKRRNPLRFSVGPVSATFISWHCWPRSFFLLPRIRRAHLQPSVTKKHVQGLSPYLANKPSERSPPSPHIRACIDATPPIEPSEETSA